VTQRLADEVAVGYSSAGTIIEVGPHVTDLRLGDRVACAGAGHANHAEVVAIPRNLVAKVPDGVGLETAALTTIVAIALNGVRLAEVSLGERVGVVGCGLIGQIACRLLAIAGADVYALDIDQARVDWAVQGGADHGLLSTASATARIAELTRGVALDSVIVTAAASTNAPLELAAKIARDRGSVVLVGAVPIEFPRALLYDKELVFRVSRSYGPGRYDLDYEERGLDYPIGYVRWTEQRNMEAILQLQAQGRLSLDDLIEGVVPIDRALEAYSRLVGSPGAQPRGALVLSYPDTEKPAAVAAERPAPVRAVKSGAVRVGLIGPGGFAARVLVPAFVAAGAELALVGGGSGPSAEAAQRRLGFSRVAASAEAVLEDPEIDAVVVAMRHGIHAELAQKALVGGKHVFCEKPLALTREELESVMEAAKTSSGILAVGFNRRFSPLLRAAVDFLSSSTGPLTAIYRVSAGHIDSDSWVHDLEQGGGRTLGEVCHFVDSLRFIAGSPIVRVHAVAHGRPDLPVQAWDNVVVSVAFESGSVGTIVYAAEGGPRVPKERLEVFRSGCTAILDDYRTLDLFGRSGHATKKLRTQDKGHRAEIEAFVEGVRNGQPPVPLADIENVSAATLALVESIRTGLTIEL
jgi:polar amino acid transport system substrate-binding protein